MNKKTFILLCTAIMVVIIGASRGQSQSNSPAQKRVVDFKADIMRPVKIGDSSALNLTGNVVFYHNGAIITCDSAIRFGDKRMECYNNVVVNKQQTYIYGDRADYNGEINIATVYAPIIKMVDKDATMYTYQFSFNTLTNVGRFGGGATLSQQDNLLESDHGYYYADSSMVVCVKDVEMRNPDYKMESDSVEYNMNTNLASFFTKSYIWNIKGEILSANRGSYIQPEGRYNFTSNSYILTANEELWSDSLDYDSKSEIALLHKDIQMINTEHSMMAFGDFAHYWGAEGKGILTREPSVINFSPDQPDTLYMRADSMFFYTFSRDSILVVDSASIKKFNSEEDTLGETLIESNEATPAADSLGLERATQTTVVSDTLNSVSSIRAEESLDMGGAQLDTKAQRKRQKQEQKRLKALAQQVSDGKLPATEIKPDISHLHDHDHAHADSVTMSKPLKSDSLERAVIGKDTISVDSLGLEPVAAEGQDSLQRLILAYRDVRMYRTDFQAVCDSLVAFSIDSTMHLYIEPVLWNEANQITSTVIDIFTKNQQLEKAVFIGDPIMSSQVDSSRFNQVKGKVMEAYFRNNAIFRNDVLGNGQTYYYMQDDETKEVTGFFVVECANITFAIDSNQVTKISYYGSPVYSIYPLAKIPADQPQILPGFRWEAKRKPTKEMVFNRTIRPSMRQYHEEMVQPTFPLTNAIMSRKATLIRDNQWRERNDKITEKVYDYIRKLGYTVTGSSGIEE